MSNKPEPQDEARDLRSMLVEELVSQGAISSQLVRRPSMKSLATYLYQGSVSPPPI